MRRYFVQNILFLILVNLLIKPFWILGIDAKVQVIFGNEVYGNYYALVNLAIIFNIILDLGLQSYSNRTVANAQNTFSRLFPNIMATKLVLSVIYLSVIMLVAVFLKYTTAATQLLFWVGLIQVLNSFYLFIRSNIAAKQLYRLEGVFSILDRTLLILIVGSIIYIPLTNAGFDILLFAKIQVATLLVTNVIGYQLLLKQYNIVWREIKLTKIKGIIRQSTPFAILIFIMAIFMKADAVLLKQISGDHAAGAFAAAFRLVDVANNMTGVILGGMLLSFFSKHLSDKEVLKNISNLCNITLLPFAIVVGIIFLLFSQEILPLIYRGESFTATENMVLLMFAYPFYCVMYIYSTLLTAFNRIKRLIGFAAIAMLFNLTLNLIFIPQYGVTATAAIHTVTIAIFSSLCWIYSSKEMHTPLLNSNTILQLLLITVLSYAIFRTVKYLAIDTIPQIVIGLVFTGIAYLILQYKAILKLKARVLK